MPLLPSEPPQFSATINWLIGWRVRRSGIIFGFGITPKLIIVAWIVFFPVVVNVLDGLASVDRDMLNLARLMGGGSLRTFAIVKLPACIGPLFSGLKIGATYAVTGAVIGQSTVVWSPRPRDAS